MEKFHVKQETLEHWQPTRKSNPSLPVPIIDLSSSDSDSFDSSSSSSSDDATGVNTKRSRASTGTAGAPPKKKKKSSQEGVVLPKGFLDPLPTAAPPSTSKANGHSNKSDVAGSKGSMQFWKSGDFEGIKTGDWDYYTAGMDHIRVHPRFLHSNATSHQWVLGAFAELLDNALDEVINGATYVTVDMIKSKKDGSKMLRIEDNGGGMNPDQMRQCMSLGYSLKSKLADTIGQYGNGFKTSTMRLGADVIVFSRCSGKNGKKATQSIGLLSYTFLRSTGKEDIIVPMVDFERSGQEWKKIIRSSPGDWNKNMETMIRWSPFSNETDLLRQFNRMKDQGTSIIVYNLWEDDQGSLELDFEADSHDIQIRGVNRDEKNIQMAKKFPNSRHFLTYKHSLRSYASILYLRIPPGFRIILRGKDVEQHNIVNDMMFTQEVSYRPQPAADGLVKDSTIVASVTVGFVKDATAHIDVQGFNVYHKNRLIKPFWRVWNASGSDGRGVIGILEADFVEPAHDKQGFERTIVLSRLEAKLVQMQKTYWSKNCHRIGYAKRYDKNDKNNIEDPSPEYTPQSEKKVAGTSVKTPVPISDKFSSYKNDKTGKRVAEQRPKTGSNGYSYGKKARKRNPDPSKKSGKRRISSSSSESSSSDDDNDDLRCGSEKGAPSVSRKNVTVQIAKTDSLAKQKDATVSGNQAVVPSDSSEMEVLKKLKEENLKLRERLNRNEEEIKAEMLNDLQYEKKRCKSLDAQVKEASANIEKLNLEQESLVKLFTEEREQRNTEEEKLRKKYREASNKIQELIEKVKLLGRPKPSKCR